MNKTRFFPVATTVPMLLWALASGWSAEPGLPGKGAGPRVRPISKVEIAITNRAEIGRLIADGFDVDSVKTNHVLLYADADELERLGLDGWKVTILKAPGPAGFPEQEALGTYNNYSNLTTMLQLYATNYPAVCRLTSLGHSVQNRELWAVKITNEPDVPADKPKFKYISTMHGNEPVGTEMCLYLIDLLVNGYVDNDPRIVSLVNKVEIWILPLMNPDGREANPPQRYNGNGYDLNRSFPEGSAANLGNVLYGPLMSTNGLQPEVAAVMAWTASHHFSLGANLHTGDLVVNYPYDNDNLGSVPSPAPDDALLRAMSLTYASNNPPMWSSPYFPHGIVNGAEWYAISGGMQDWNYRYAGCIDVTIELANYQWPDPPASQLATYWSQNQESMLAYLEWGLKGVRGVMRDAHTGQPVGGAVRVEGYPHLVFSEPNVGDFHRLLLPGTYTLWFYAPGYIAQRVPNVSIGNGAATRLDIALQPASPLFTAKINFQPPGAVAPQGFVADSGAAFGPRAGGYTYGWETTLAPGNLLERHAGRSQDLRYDTLCQMQAGTNHTWEIAVPNGPYSVLLAAGDPAYSNGWYRVAAENVLLLDGLPSSSNRWVEGLGVVTVTNGRLTLSSWPGASSNRLAFAEISAVEPATIEQWRARFFGTTSGAGASADGADPDGDGIPNLLEYAFGLDPTHYELGPQLSPLVVHTNNADWFGCSFLRNTNATDVSFGVQVTSSVANWSWFETAAYTNGGGWVGPGLAWERPANSNCVSVSALDTQPISSASNRFMRLRVTRQ